MLICLSVACIVVKRSHSIELARVVVILSKHICDCIMNYALCIMITNASQSSLSFLVKQWFVEKSLSCSVIQLVHGRVPLIPSISMVTKTNTHTNTNLKHEVECPGHDDGVVEGDHGGNAEEAVPHPSEARDKAGEDLREAEKIVTQRNANLCCRCACVLAKDILHEEEGNAKEKKAEKIPDEQKLEMKKADRLAEWALVEINVRHTLEIKR